VLNAGFALLTVSGESLPIFNVLLTLSLWRLQLRMRNSVANITDELILGLDILRTYDASVVIERQKLRLAEKELSLWSPGAGTHLPF
jgi:hypothetical protein